MIVLGSSTLHWVRNKTNISRHITYNMAYLHPLDVRLIIYIIIFLDTRND